MLSLPRSEFARLSVKDPPMSIQTCQRSLTVDPTNVGEVKPNEPVDILPPCLVDTDSDDGAAVRAERDLPPVGDRRGEPGHPRSGHEVPDEESPSRPRLIRWTEVDPFSP